MKARLNMHILVFEYPGPACSYLVLASFRIIWNGQKAPDCHLNTQEIPADTAYMFQIASTATNNETHSMITVTDTNCRYSSND